MEFLWEVLRDAIGTLTEASPQLWTVVSLTLIVSAVSTLVGVLLGTPVGVALALGRFRGRGALQLMVSVGMGFPPVLAGLLLLLLFWRSGPLGDLGLIFTPTAMVVAQVVLAAPIAAGVTAGAIKGLGGAAREQLRHSVCGISLGGWWRSGRLDPGWRRRWRPVLDEWWPRWGRFWWWVEISWVRLGCLPP